MIRLFALFLLLTGFNSFSQEAIKLRPSPLAIASSRYKDTYLKIVYSQPQKRGREIFGSLVPYGEVWRTGANEATEITFTKDIMVNNLLMKAGNYSLFTIPDQDSWTIIFNSELGLWGSYNYNSKLDILRFKVPVQHIEDLIYESFTITVDQKNDKADFTLMWDRTRISFPIQFIEIKP
ncbi:MAG: DUF2911 domain-containing protein [Bacteroidia bacterium]|nr:DUF2911 domain-containing protein [Bacteroidia bacterium]